jgi:farnesyl-diphosphate farnesyltransferase
MPSLTNQTNLLLKEVSRSFYLSLRFLPGPVRPGLSLAYLLARASDTLADAPQLPTTTRLGELERFRKLVLGQTTWETCREPWLKLTSGLPHPGERRLLPAIGDVLAETAALTTPEQAAIHQVLLTILSGQQLDLERFPDPAEHRVLPDADSLLDYTYRVAGCVGEFWTKMLALRVPGSLLASQEQMELWGRHLGQGLQLVNILRDIPEDLANGRGYLPQGDVSPEARHYWLSKARELLADGERYVRHLQGRRLKFTADLPRRLALPTLDLVERAPVSGPKVKISRSVVRKAAWAALWAAF